ncbi:NB-ARC domain-containing protein [Micromonospora sp. NPDC048930]|uniref:NB-ARC domain-containing protein n=1 Tax=Micromonospora sp. NPDC048930 TaxID=3364261 RepID=UPI0037249E0A
MEIDDLSELLDFVGQLADRGGKHWRNIAETRRKLDSNPAYVLGLKINLPTDPTRSPQHNLPVPDFDETGFFGRQQQLTRIKRAIKGAYPVVSVLGEGGIGKTSIALKAAYDLLDEPGIGFDAFVWVSAKATVLTPNEIQRISGAIKDSLGLFTKAAAELGVPDAGADPVEEVLSYLANFKVLLILDNLETVLDQRLRNFLLELPLGSKVIITSRIGLGIENPVSLEPLSEDDGMRLLRAVAGIRGAGVLKQMSNDIIRAYVQKMGGHPAYIKWFVAGVQAGRRPEELVSDNALLLDFCMSNVYGYLSTDAQDVLRCMQVLPGARNQAELAFLNDFTASRIQAALLELITTNFVQMRSQSTSASEIVDTTYQLTDFGKQYLDKRHPVSSKDRSELVRRHQRLHSVGADLRAESSASPYSPETVDVRGTGDFNVARLLRDALLAANRGDSDEGLSNCREAQTLAPTYHEAWRVEAHIQVIRSDYGAARAAYERAHELAPGSPTLNYFYGSFLLDEGDDPARGLEFLQSAARFGAPNAVVMPPLAWALLRVEDYHSALEVTMHALETASPYQPELAPAVTTALRAAVYWATTDRDRGDLEGSLHAVEAGKDVAKAAPVELLMEESRDRIMQLALAASDLSNASDENFVVRKAREFQAELQERVRTVEPSWLDRRIGVVKNIVSDKYYGFLTYGNRDYFYHLRDLVEPAEWEYISEGTPVAFNPNRSHPKGHRAEWVRWLG